MNKIYLVNRRICFAASQVNKRVQMGLFVVPVALQIIAHNIFLFNSLRKRELASLGFKYFTT